MHTLTLGSVLILTVLAPWTAMAAACNAESGRTFVPLLELYTSEGCDSCPPADRWLAALPQRGFDRDRLTRLAFHVDYWNDLGWVDPFAQRAFTARQREFTRRSGASTVYTPALVLNGLEYRGWSNGDLGDSLKRLDSPPRADITLSLDSGTRTLTITGNARLRDRAASASLYVAVYENNLQSDVRAGENRGRTLHHDAVVRRLLGPIAFGADGKTQLRESVTLAPDWKTADLGAAAFVQEAKGNAILQTLSLACR